MARLQETARELLDSELQKFREKIKCLEDELCEKHTIISDQAETLCMKNTRFVLYHSHFPHPRYNSVIFAILKRFL